VVKRKAVFLDRDGVIVEDVDCLVRAEDIRIFGYVPQALRTLREKGFELVVVSNQPVVARGLVSEEGVGKLNREIAAQIEKLGGPLLEHFYFCPHHPNATLPEYRVNCECRKPRTGMLREAATFHSIDLSRSIMVGDRITDIIAGRDAGCVTVMVETGEHLKPPIETPGGIDFGATPDKVFPTLEEAAAWIAEDA